MPKLQTRTRHSSPVLEARGLLARLDEAFQCCYPSLAGFANKPSLIEARLNFARARVCEDRLVKHVRPPLPEEIPR